MCKARHTHIHKKQLLEQSVPIQDDAGKCIANNGRGTTIFDGERGRGGVGKGGGKEGAKRIEKRGRKRDTQRQTWSIVGLRLWKTRRDAEEC